MPRSLDCVEASPDLSVSRYTMAITHVFVGDSPMTTCAQITSCPDQVLGRAWFLSFLPCVLRMLDPVP